MLSAGDHIRNLLGLYCVAVDAGDWEAVGSLFARGTLATDDGTPLASGAAPVAEFYRGATKLHDGSPRTTHVVADTVIDLEGPGLAVVRSTYVVFQALDDFPLQPIITGRYMDRFADDGGWHFTERRFAVDLVGDVSRHLAFRL